MFAKGHLTGENILIVECCLWLFGSVILKRSKSLNTLLMQQLSSVACKHCNSSFALFFKQITQDVVFLFAVLQFRGHRRAWVL